MESVEMKKILRYLLLVLCLISSVKLNVNAAENTYTLVKLTGITNVKIYTSDKKQEIPVENDTFYVKPGEYCYESTNGAGGNFSVSDETTELNLTTVTFKNVSPTHWLSEENRWGYLPDLGELKLYDEEKQNEYWHATDNVYQYMVPQYAGDHYYIFKFTPFDENYLSIEGHFYVYGQTTFGSLNLSDTGKIPYLKKKYITIKAPVGMEVYTTWQLKFYTARNWETYKSEEKNGYTYYYDVPEGFTYMLRQEGKVTRYTKNLDGKWNADHTEITLNPLENNPTQIHREQEKDGIYASMLTNLPENSEIDLKVGEYFDLVPLRAWQAVEDGVSNKHNDPEWHYVILGGDEKIASVEVTKDDKIGQFGRIHANKEGTVLVAFYYDAVETSSATSGTGSYLYSALLPELTGMAVVHVGSKYETEITSNIDMIEGRTVYYLKSQKDANGVSYDMNNSAEYTFSPTAKTGENTEKITSVRVHTPITVTNGKLSANPSDWLTDSSWTTYQPNETEDGKQSYTIKLSEGRNIVEIKAGDATTYHVILARGLDVTIDNVYRPGQKLETGDTAKVTLENMIPPLFKMSAIYNPGGVDFVCKTNGVDYTAHFGQYMAGSSFIVKLQDEDAGIYKITEGALTTHAWGTTDGAHRRLTRNSMATYWNGGNNPDIDYGKMAYLPEISFTVESNDDYEEAVNRSAGLLKALGVALTNSSSPIVQGTGAVFATSSKDVNQNVNRSVIVNGVTMKCNVNVGAELLQNDENAKLLVRYWLGNDDSKAVVQEMDFSKSFMEDDIGGKLGKIYGNPLSYTGTKLRTSKEMHVETIVLPSSGTPMTYATHLYMIGQHNNVSFIPENIKILSASGDGKLDRWDGILKADDITYKDSEGNTITQDLGYGFIGSEKHFTTSVSNDVDNIRLEVTSSVIKMGTNPNKPVLKDVSITLNDSEKEYKEGDTIPLTVGTNTLKITCNAAIGKSRTYTIDVTRRTAAKQTTFEIPDGASVLVMQGNKVMKANEDGTYTLENGTYTYHVSKTGYLTTTDNFEVTDEEPTQVIKVTDLEKVPEQSGTVSVQLAGQSTVFCPTRSVEIQQTAEDLAANRYVQYNHGGYTVLHALLDAAKASGTDFECYRGKFVLVDDSITENNGKKAGWICKVNGIECSDPANTLANADDKIDLFYNSGWSGMKQARLTPENGEVTRGDSIILTLNGTAVHATDADAATIAGAEIYDGNTPITTTDEDGKEFIATTDENGEVTIDTRTLTLGTHYFSAVLKDEDGHNILTATMSTINVKKPDNPSADPTKTEVTFRLIGDTKHGEEGSDNEAVHAYTTWIATGTYTFDGDNVTVGQVFEAALKEAGLSYEGMEKNYISAITAPESCGGFELREKDNGKNSGWMYTVNGVHPSMGMNDWYVSTGDEIIWHYIDDYTTEQADMKNDDGSYGSAGNASTWNKWLEAADETPGAKQRAAAVTGKINQIGETIELTDECEAKITAAREAYNELSREEKGYVTNYDALTAAETELARLKKEADDKAAAAKVTDLIEALPAVKDLTLEDQEDVVAARTAYGNLTNDQKDYVTTETYGTLVLAEEQIAKLLDAAAVDELLKEIEALPDAENVTLENETAIASALAHYNALSKEQQADLEERSPDSLTKLNDVIDRLKVLKEEAADQKAVDEVNEKLNALPAAEDILFANETAVTEARNAYEALDEIKEGLKDRVSAEALAKLTAAEDRLDALQEGVDHVAELIEALPAVDDLTVADADQVQEARDAYNALNNDQKQQLTDSGLLGELLVAENQIGWLQKDAEAAKKVTDRINSLPAVKDLRLSDKTAVEAARYAYDNLSDEQKQYVSEDTLKALEEREAEIKRLEEVTPNPTPTPDPNPSDDPKQDEDRVTLTYQNYPISVTGKLSGYELRLTALKADDDVVKQMQNMISSKEALIRLYDVALYKDGKEVEWNDKLTVNFQVGTSYNGQTLSVLHEVNGKLETLSGTVSNGILSVTANGTGSFGVVVPASTVSTGNGSSNNNGSTGTFTNGNLGGGSTGTGNGTTAVSGTGKVTSAKTGDDTDILFPIAGLITATGVLAGVVLYYKKKKRITGVQTEEE